jgi:hypothetical protein
MGGKKLGVGCDAITFAHDQNVAGNDLAAWYAPLHTIPNHECARTGEVAQALQDALRLQVLINDNPKVDQGQDCEERSLVQIAY